MQKDGFNTMRLRFLTVAFFGISCEYYCIHSYAIQSTLWHLLSENAGRSRLVGTLSATPGL